MSKSNPTRRRDTSAIANQRLPVSINRPTVTSSPTRFGFSPLRELEDRRSYHPDGRSRPARTFSSPGSRLTVVDRVFAPRTAGRIDASRSYSALWSGTRASVAFANPSRTIICVRRQQRREVLHALHKTRSGRGGRSHWSEYSNIRCK